MSALLPQRLAAVETPMQGSLGHIIWTFCYLSVLVGLSAYGVHRYFIIYLYLKNRKRAPVPARYFEHLPKVTMQLPIFNEVYVAERDRKTRLNSSHQIISYAVFCLKKKTPALRRLYGRATACQAIVLV